MQTKRIPIYLLWSIAVTITLSSLFFTHYLAGRLAQSERTKARIWAMSVKKALETDENEFLHYLFQVRDSLNVPAIVTDDSGRIIFFKGMKGTQQELRAHLEEMQSENSPILITLPHSHHWYLNYRDSEELDLLQIFPYIQLSFIALFLLLAYHSFNVSRKNVQNLVWVGMAKETAHQLGTPISSLMAWIELAKSAKNDAELQRYFGEMLYDTKRLEIISDRFNKIGTKPILTSQNIYEVIDNYIAYFRTRMPQEVGIEINADKGLCADINVQLIEWVIENLFKNAVDAMSTGGNIKVNIAESKDSKWVIIDVSDTGNGIPSSKIKSVFNPGVTTKKYGWGLGLSLVKRIVEYAHGGKITVLKSVVGVGTTFRILLKNSNPRPIIGAKAKKD